MSQILDQCLSISLTSALIKCHKKTLCWVHLHMITILGRLPAKGESTRWPNPKFNPSFLLDNCRPELVSHPTHLVALVPKPSQHHQGLEILLPTDLSELELVSAWLAAWAVVVVLQTTDFKRKARGQTKLGLKTQEERSRRARCAHAHVSPGAPSGGNCHRRRWRRRRRRWRRLPGRRTCKREWQAKPPVFFLHRLAGPSC